MEDGRWRVEVGRWKDKGRGNTPAMQWGMSPTARPGCLPLALSFRKMQNSGPNGTVRDVPHCMAEVFALYLVLPGNRKNKDQTAQSGMSPRVSMLVSSFSRKL